MTKTGTVTVALGSELEARLAELAARTRSTPSEVAVKAIEAYLDLQAWQVAEIARAVAEADAGDFLSDADLMAAVKRWTS